MNLRFWQRPPDKDPASIGRMLRDNGLITDDELDRALKIQGQRDDVRLGEILVEIEAVEQGIVDAVLHIQDARKRRDVDRVVELVCEQSQQVDALHDAFINGHGAKKAKA